MSDHSDPDRLRVLAAWVDAFERPGFVMGAWAGGARDDSGVTQLPYVELSAEGSRFVKEMAASGWVDVVDWMAWASTTSAQDLIRDPGRVASASAEDLARLLTTAIRGDRFAEGQLLAAFERGTLTAIARRARALLGGSALDDSAPDDAP